MPPVVLFALGVAGVYVALRASTLLIAAVKDRPAAPPEPSAGRIDEQPTKLVYDPARGVYRVRGPDDPA